MLSALLSFLGGSAFRMVWGEVASYFTRKREHEEELERMKLQGELDAAAHERNLSAMKFQAELGIKEIVVKSDAEISKAEVDAWAQAVADVGKKTGIKWLDAWNGAIRPFLATVATAMVIGRFWQSGFVLTDWDMGLISAILGIYVADRSLQKRGK